MNGGEAAGWDFVNAITVDGSSNIYLAGYTSGALGETNGGGNDAFVAKLNSIIVNYPNTEESDHAVDLLEKLKELKSKSQQN